MDTLDLLYDTVALHITGDTLEVIIFTINLGAVRLVLPIEILADFFERMNNGLEKWQSEN